MDANYIAKKMIKNTADVKQKSRAGRSRWGRVTKVFGRIWEI